jgi:hypothetical protein
MTSRRWNVKSSEAASWSESVFSTPSTREAASPSYRPSILISSIGREKVETLIVYGVKIGFSF